MLNETSWLFELDQRVAFQSLSLKRLIKSNFLSKIRGMTRHQISWVVRNNKGKIRGPFTTVEVLQFISDGVFVGDEMVAQYPNGKWTLMSKEPEFYEKMIETLEQNAKPLSDEKTSAFNDEATVIVPFEESKKPLSKNSERTEVQKIETQIPLPEIDKAEAKSQVIDLFNLESAKVDKIEILKKVQKPLLLVLAAALIGIGIIYLQSGEEDHQKLRLLRPTKTSEALPEDQIKEKMKMAVKLLEKDMVSKTVEAENLLITIIEGAPRHLESRGLLCFVYKELWPYAFQDSEDEKTISLMLQSTKSINALNPNGILCEVIKMYTMGRVKEARGAIDTLLEMGDKFSLYPLLYEMKGDLIAKEKEYSLSRPYFEKASQLWPTWTKPVVELSRIHFLAGNYGLSAENYRKSLSLNPKHKGAYIGLGILDFKGFNQYESARKNLLAGLEIDERVESTLESEGYEALTEIYLLQGEKAKAKEIACRSLEISPSRKEAKEICARLGGSVQTTGSRKDEEMFFIGEQYFRAGDFLSAQAEYKAAFEINPKNAKAALRAGESLWKLNQSFDALDWLKKAVKADPQLISAYVLQADYYSQRYDFVSADNALATALRAAPNNHEVYRGMSVVSFRRNDYPTALTLADRASKIYDADVKTQVLLSDISREYAKKLRPLNEKDREKREVLVKDTMKYATKAVELDATYPDAQIAYAKMLALTSGVDAGISYLTELIKKYSYSIEFKLALAEILMGEDRYRQAIEVLEQVQTSDAKNKKALLFLGTSHKAMGTYDKALSYFLNAAIIDPTDAEPLFQAGQLYLETNRFEEAREQFIRVQRINPKYPRAYFFIAKANYLTGNMTEALLNAELEKKAYPNIVDSYLLTAEIHSAKQKYSECAAEYSRAIKLNSQSASIYVKAAKCYRLSGSLDIAEDMLALARERENGYAEIFREQGVIFQTRGLSREALKAFQTYLELSPNAPDKAEVEALIQRIGGG